MIVSGGAASEVASSPRRSNSRSMPCKPRALNQNRAVAAVLKQMYTLAAKNHVGAISSHDRPSPCPSCDIQYKPKQVTQTNSARRTNPSWRAHQTLRILRL